MALPPGPRSRRGRPQDAVLSQPRRPEHARPSNGGRHDEREDRKDSDIKTDAPGLSGQSFGSGKPALGETDFHQQEEDRWAKDAAEELKRRALRNDFEALAIIAPPRRSASFRQGLHKEVERRIVMTLNKEMTGRPIPDIEELLVGEGAAPA